MALELDPARYEQARLMFQCLTRNINLIVLGFISDNPGVKLKDVQKHTGYQKARACQILRQLKDHGLIRGVTPKSVYDPAWYIQEKYFSTIHDALDDMSIQAPTIIYKTKRA